MDSALPGVGSGIFKSNLITVLTFSQYSYAMMQASHTAKVPV